MGSPVSVTVANLAIEDVEDRVLATTDVPFRFWWRYVDDTCIALPASCCQELHKHLISIETSSHWRRSQKGSFRSWMYTLNTLVMYPFPPLCLKSLPTQINTLTSLPTTVTLTRWQWSAHFSTGLVPSRQPLRPTRRRSIWWVLCWGMDTPRGSHPWKCDHLPCPIWCGNWGPKGNSLPPICPWDLRITE